MQELAWTPLARRDDVTFVHSDRCRSLLRVDVRTYRGRTVLRAIRALDARPPCAGAALRRKKMVQSLIAFERCSGAFERVQELDSISCALEPSAPAVSCDAAGCEIEGVTVIGGVSDLTDDENDAGVSELSPDEQRAALDGVDSSTYFFLPHTADVCPVARGSSVGEALMNYVLALCNYMTDTRHASMGIPGDIEDAYALAATSRSVRVMRLRIASRDSCPRRALQNLIFKTLDTYLNVFQQYKLVFRHGRVLKDVTPTQDGFEVELEFVGARFSRVRHVVGTEVKAITLHMLLLQRNDDVLLSSSDAGGDHARAATEDAAEGDLARTATWRPSVSVDASATADGLRTTMQQYRSWYASAREAAEGRDVYRLQLVVDI